MTKCAVCGSLRNDYHICVECIKKFKDENENIFYESIHKKYKGRYNDLVKDHVKLLRQLEFWRRQAEQVGIMESGS